MNMECRPLTVYHRPMVAGLTGIPEQYYSEVRTQKRVIVMFFLSVLCYEYTTITTCAPVEFFIESLGPTTVCVNYVDHHRNGMVLKVELVRFRTGCNTVPGRCLHLSPKMLPHKGAVFIVVIEPN